MKKGLWFLAVLFLMVACEGPAGPPGKDGIDGIGGIFTIKYPVKQNHWEQDLDANGNLFYYCSFNEPELDSYMYENGEISVVLEWTDSNGVRYKEPIRNRANRANNFNWIQIIEYEYSVGNIIFYYTNSDYVYANGEPGDHLFAVTYIYP